MRNYSLMAQYFLFGQIINRPKVKFKIMIGVKIRPGVYMLISKYLGGYILRGRFTINIDAKTSGRIGPGNGIPLVRQSDLLTATRDVGLGRRS